MKNTKLQKIMMSCFIFLMVLVGNTGAQAVEKYVIGAMMALSGPGHGKTIDDGVKLSYLAVKEINQRGGVDGVKMELIWEDHKARGPEAVAGFRKLVDINHAQAIAMGFTTPIMACAPIADQMKILFMNVGAYGPKVAGAGKYLFSLPANELVYIPAMLDYAKKNRNLKSLGLIYANDDMGLSVREFLKTYCQNVGIKFVGSEAFDFSATDYSGQIEKAKRWNADGVYLSIQVHPGVVRQATEKGWTPQWLGVPLYTFEEHLFQSGQGIKGAITACTDSNMDRNPGWAKVKETWEKEYGEGSWPRVAVVHMSYLYDYVYIVKKLIEYGKGKGWKDYWSGERLRQGLIEIKSFDGCLGKINFDVETGLSSRNIEILVATENPTAKGTYFWKSSGFYTANEIIKLSKMR